MKKTLCFTAGLITGIVISEKFNLPPMEDTALKMVKATKRKMDEIRKKLEDDDGKK